MTPAANNPTPSKPPRWLRPVASAAAVIALSAATGWGVASLAPRPGSQHGKGARRAQAAPPEDADRRHHLRWPWRPVRSRLEIDAVLRRSRGQISGDRAHLRHGSSSRPDGSPSPRTQPRLAGCRCGAAEQCQRRKPACPARHPAEGIARWPARERRDHLGTSQWSQGRRLLRLSTAATARSSKPN
jgi:hypothetical protein